MHASSLRSRSLVSSLVLAAGAFASACVASDDRAAATDDATARPATIEASAAPAAEGRPITEAEIREISSHPRFREMTETLAENGSSIDLTKGSTFTYERDENAVEILFHPTDADGNPDRDYAELVYQRVGQLKDPFAFTPHGIEGAKPAFETSSAAPDCSASGSPTPPPDAKDDDVETQGCTAWSSWYLVNTACEPRFWCFGQSQMGTYAYWRKHRYCSWGTHIRNRRDFVGCGC